MNISAEFKHVVVFIHYVCHKTPQIGHWLRLISHRSLPVDQLILHRARYNHANVSLAYL